MRAHQVVFFESSSVQVLSDQPVASILTPADRSNFVAQNGERGVREVRMLRDLCPCVPLPHQDGDEQLLRKRLKGPGHRAGCIPVTNPWVKQWRTCIQLSESRPSHSGPLLAGSVGTSRGPAPRPWRWVEVEEEPRGVKRLL